MVEATCRARRERMTDDREVVDKCRGGDGAAFEQLYRRYHGRVYRLAMRLLGNSEDARDQTQESFIRAWQAIGSFKGEARFSTWLMRIAYNRCLDFRRSRCRRRTLSLDTSTTEGDGPGLPEPGTPEWCNPCKQAQFDELKQGVQRGMTTLGDNHRTVLSRYLHEDLRYHDLAGELHISDGTVMSRLFHARKRLHEALVRQGLV